MLNISTPRFIWTFVVGALITSNINWGIAEFFLNDWAIPRFEGFMRSGEGAGSVTNILRMTFGFMIPLFVTAFLQRLDLVKPTPQPTGRGKQRSGITSDVNEFCFWEFTCQLFDATRVRRALDHKWTT